jgi:hypothetical protein
VAGRATGGPTRERDRKPLVIRDVHQRTTLGSVYYFLGSGQVLFNNDFRHKAPLITKLATTRFWKLAKLPAATVAGPDDGPVAGCAPSSTGRPQTEPRLIRGAIDSDVKMIVVGFSILRLLEQLHGVCDVRAKVRIALSEAQQTGAQRRGHKNMRKPSPAVFHPRLHQQPVPMVIEEATTPIRGLTITTEFDELLGQRNRHPARVFDVEADVSIPTGLVRIVSVERTSTLARKIADQHTRTAHRLCNLLRATPQHQHKRGVPVIASSTALPDFKLWSIP